MNKEKPIREIDGLSDVIADAVHCMTTPEGHKLWEAVFEWAYGDGELPQMLEEEK